LTYIHYTPRISSLIYSDIWAIGVITYFLLCGYTPFDRDSNLEEMQAILVADYSFTPIEYWRGVSDTAKDFIRHCLTIDPNERMTSHQALNHPWIKEEDTVTKDEERARRKEGETDLLPTVRKNFNARVKLHAAIDTIRAINQLRAGQQAAMMNGAKSRNPPTGAPPAGNATAGLDGQGALGQQDIQPRADEMEGLEATGQLGNADTDAMEIDSRGNARGQTEEQIREQERRIQQTMQALWGKR
jgi:calcium/calmodulin-dependent protein kinase I